MIFTVAYLLIDYRDAYRSGFVRGVQTEPIPSGSGKGVAELTGRAHTREYARGMYTLMSLHKLTPKNF